MNRLANETSPYLRQHADNPVDWYPWSSEALEIAKSKGAPLLISIGYAACHWCHVMAHESFEDETVAKVVNDHFVAIKIDREQRPDLDAVYLEAVQALTGSGGWPLTIFATPDGRPFFGGTYFPKQASHGLPSFSDLLTAVIDAWREHRGELLDKADELTNAIGDRLEHLPSSGRVAVDSTQLIAEATKRFRAIFDERNGGIGTAPKFPQPPMLDLIGRAALGGDHHARTMLDVTLSNMASGGIYDQLGGGFHRYSVDAMWRVPHFEKMLYDQAGLARVYLHHWQLTGDPRWRQVVDETVEFVLRELRDGGGGFYASLDADSDGAEGLFYTWTKQEIQATLDERLATVAASGFAVASDDIDGRSVLARAPRGAIVRSIDEESARRLLFAARSSRERPATDDKVLTEWNAMMISTLAEIAMATGDARFAAPAMEAASFLTASLRDDRGRWLRSYTNGRAEHLGLAADHGWLVDAFVRLYELTGDANYLNEAQSTGDALLELFRAPDGGWYMTGVDAEELVVRPRDTYDGVVASTGSIATTALARLGAVTGISRYADAARESFDALSEALATSPLGFAHLVCQSAFILGLSAEVLVSGDRRDLVEEAHRHYLPDAVIAWGSPVANPLWEGRTGSQAYVCHRGVCQAPTASVEELRRELESLALPT